MKCMHMISRDRDHSVGRGVIFNPKIDIADFGPIKVFLAVFRKKMQYNFPE